MFPGKVRLLAVAATNAYSRPGPFLLVTEHCVNTLERIRILNKATWHRDAVECVVAHFFLF